VSVPEDINLLIDTYKRYELICNGLDKLALHCDAFSSGGVLLAVGVKNHFRDANQRVLKAAYKTLESGIYGETEQPEVTKEATPDESEPEAQVRETSETHWHTEPEQQRIDDTVNGWEVAESLADCVSLLMRARKQCG
jgi:hypothetical protein